MSCRFISPLAIASLLLGVSVVVFFGCVSSSPPGPRDPVAPIWVTDKDSVYPVDEYLAEVGEGDSLNAAKSNAAGAIAQIFRTRVTVDASIRTRYSEIAGPGGSNLGIVTQTDFDRIIGQSAQESLSNMKFGESWQDPMGRVYTAAYLNRAETGNLYRQRIVENDNRVVELMDRARGEDEVLRRYAFLDAAQVLAQANVVLLEQLEIINMPMARSVLQPYDLGRLRAARADQAAALKMRVEVSGEDEGLMAAVLSDWVTTKGFPVSEDGDMFLAAVVVVTPVELDNNYESLSWELNLNLIDSAGYPAVSLSRQDRSTGISESAARSRVYQDMTEIIHRDFDTAFNAYLNSFLEK